MRLLFLFLLTGCISWENFGVTSTGTHNRFVEEVQDFKDDVLPPIEELGEAVAENAHENVLEAKRDNDETKLVRSVATRVKAEEAISEIKELEAKKFTRAEAPPFDWEGLIATVVSALMGGGGVGAVVMAVMGSKLKTMKERAIYHAKSTEVDDVSDLT